MTDLARDNQPQFLTMTQAAEMCQEFVNEAVLEERYIQADPNSEGTVAFGYANELAFYGRLVAKLARLLPGPRGRELMFTMEESEALALCCLDWEGSNP
jgi:hypothetical protein